MPRNADSKQKGLQISGKVVKHTPDKKSWRVKVNEIKNELNKIEANIKEFKKEDQLKCNATYNFYKKKYNKLKIKWGSIGKEIPGDEMSATLINLSQEIHESFKNVEEQINNLCSEFVESTGDQKVAIGGKRHSKRTKTKKLKKSSSRNSKKGGVGLASMLMPQGLNPLLATVGLAALAKSKKTKKSLSKVAKTAKKDVKKVVRKTGKVAKKVAKSAKKVVRKTGKVAKKVAKTAKKDVKKVAKSAKKVVRKTGKVAKKVAKSAKKVVRKTKK
jgi:hypothetical protein